MQLINELTLSKDLIKFPSITPVDAGAIKFAIDDSPKHVAEYAKHGIFCYMPKKNYNKEIRGMNKTHTYPHPKNIFRGCF